MPITFEVCGDNISAIFSTDRCGTCDKFWHRGLRAGGCRIENKKGEISIDTPKCIAYVLKDKYRSAVEHEIKMATGLV